MRILAQTLSLLLTFPLAAQITTAPKNTVAICSESCTIVSSTAAAIYQFGANGTFNTVTAPKYPLPVTCATSCPQLGGDPVPNIVKTIYAVEQAASYTVTWQAADGVKTIVTVPALAVVTPPAATTYTITCAALNVPIPLPTIPMPATCTAVAK